jgi:hypothetical protein
VVSFAQIQGRAQWAAEPQLRRNQIQPNGYEPPAAELRKRVRGNPPRVQIPGKSCGAPNAATAAFTHTGSFVVADAGLHDQRADSNADSNPTDY